LTGLTGFFLFVSRRSKQSAIACGEKEAVVWQFAR
jgi:hypothetical protein